jgi:putative spermidine/putrescine transport system permease protein
VKLKLGSILLAIYSVVILLFLLTPIIVIVLSSFTETNFIAFPPEGFSLKWYRAILDHPEFIQSLTLSIYVALGTALIATLFGTLAALALVRYEFKGKEAIIQLIQSPLLIPSIVIGIALLQFYTWIGIAASPVALIIGHVILAIPFVVRLVTANLVNFNRTIEDAAYILGASKINVFFQITLPIIKSGVIAGGIFAFITSFDDLTVSLFIVSTDIVTLPVRIYTYMQYQYDPIITSISTIMIVLTVILIVVIERIIGVGKLFSAK